MATLSAEGAAQDDAWEAAAQRLLAEGAAFEEHWATYQEIYAGRSSSDGPPQAWRPDVKARQHANLTWLNGEVGGDDFPTLHRWSVENKPKFWHTSLTRVGALYINEPTATLQGGDPRDPEWLADAALNATMTCFRAREERTAIISGGEGKETRRVSYGELKQLADRVSHGLRHIGLQRGDAVALYLPMNVECVAAYLGIVQAGMVVVSIPDSFAPQEVATRLRLGEAKALITVDHYMRGGKQMPMRSKAVEAAEMAGIVRVITVAHEAVDLREGDLLWRHLLRDDGPFEAAPCTPQDTSNILFSSGTTGEPKAIPWTHLTPFKAAIDGHWHQDIHPDDVVAWPTNIGWMMGPWLIYATFMNRATMALYEGVPTTQGFVDFLGDAKVSVLGVVPAIVRAWRSQGLVGPGDMPHVRVFTSTGEASNAADYLYLMSLGRYQAPIIEYCGGTEIGGGHLTGTVVQPASPATFTTPAMGLDFVLRDEQGVVEGPGMGELFLIPPSLGLSQRLLNRDHHAEYYRDCPAGPEGKVLRRHGDEVQRLHQGFYAAMGRADDTMNLGGIKVSSIELERAMDAHPAVVESAAVAIPPTGGGADRLVVFVVPDGVPEMAALKAGLQDLIKSQLNPLFRIHEVVTVPALPRTASNKVMRRSLRAEYDG